MYVDSSNFLQSLKEVALWCSMPCAALGNNIPSAVVQYTNLSWKAAFKATYNHVYVIR